MRNCTNIFSHPIALNGIIINQLAYCICHLVILAF